MWCVSTRTYISTRPYALFLLVGPTTDSNFFFTLYEMSLQASTQDIPKYMTDLLQP